MRPSEPRGKLRAAKNTIFCLTLAAGVSVIAPLTGAQELKGESDKVRARLDANRNLLKESRARAGTIRSNMTQLRQERANLNTSLIKTSEQIKLTEGRMTAIEDRLGRLERQESQARSSLNRQHKTIGRLLAAMQRMGRNPPPVMITQRSDALRMVRSAMLLARAFPKLRGEAELLSGQLSKLVNLMTGIRKESEQLRSESVRLNEARTRLAYLMQTKKQSLNVRRLELAEVEKTVNVVSKNVDNLEQLIAKIGRAIDRRTKLGAEINEAIRKSPAKLPPAVVPTEKPSKLPETKVAINVPKPPVAPTAPGLKPSIPAIKLAPSGGQFIGDAARLGPAIPFHRAKGRLPMPAAGAIETNYGEATRFGGRSKGMVIKTRYGAQITSPCDGWVVYAGKFRTYGQLIIIKAGAGYHVLLAGLSRIDVRSGQFILAAEPVGTMKSAPGRRAGKGSPRLYVEFRKDGRPINPRPWWSASATQKVQG